MLRRIFQGSKPTAASTTPTRIESRISRNATARGEPPRKRCRPSLLAGKGLVSLFGIGIVRLLVARILMHAAEKWEPCFLHQEGCGLLIRCGVRGSRKRRALQQLLQCLQPVCFARRFVPAQPA